MSMYYEILEVLQEIVQEFGHDEGIDELGLNLKLIYTYLPVSEAGSDLLAPAACIYIGDYCVWDSDKDIDNFDGTLSTMREHVWNNDGRAVKDRIAENLKKITQDITALKDLAINRRLD